MHWTAADPRRLISRCISRSNCMTWRRSGHEWWVMWSTMIRVDLTGTRLQEMMISSYHDLLGYCISFKLSLISGLRERLATVSGELGMAYYGWKNIIWGGYYADCVWANGIVTHSCIVWPDDGFDKQIFQPTSVFALSILGLWFAL